MYKLLALPFIIILTACGTSVTENPIKISSEPSSLAQNSITVPIDKPTIPTIVSIDNPTISTPQRNRLTVSENKISLPFNLSQDIDLFPHNSSTRPSQYTIINKPHFGSLTAIKNGLPGEYTYTPMGEYIGYDVFTYHIDNNGGQQAITVTVKLTSATWPVSFAGKNQTVYANTQVLLRGKGFNSGLSAYDDQGNKLPLSYDWEQVDNSGITVVMQGKDNALLRIQTPDVVNPVQLKFKLSVETTQGVIDTDTVLITIKPASSQAHVILGAFVTKDAWNPNKIDRFNTATGMPVSIVNLFTGFEGQWSRLKTQLDNVRSRNAVPMITWMPQLASSPETRLLDKINQGDWDTYINDWITGLKTWQASYPTDAKPRVLIRFAHEFNAKWYPWGNDPVAYRQAWQYIHDRFSAANVQGVEWVWCMSTTDYDDFNDVTRYYPGDDYVDWTSIDGYNWGSNRRYHPWKSFSEVFSSAYNTLTSHYPRKPIMIGEVSSAEPSDLPEENGFNGDDSDADESKGAWITDLFASLETSFPAIRALVWFNHDKELSWALDGENSTGAAAYKEVVNQNDYFGGVYVPASDY
ncbi:MAG: hypothetical protein KAH22_00990 [Thiotrichaceae bacterium]|nr:hypothetical protein [Thiotrichaceae bacterium]